MYSENFEKRKQILNIIYHGLRLWMASHSWFKKRALLKRPTVAFSPFQATQSNSILCTASCSWLVPSLAEEAWCANASNLVKLNLSEFPSCRQSPLQMRLLKRKSSWQIQGSPLGQKVKLYKNSDPLAVKTSWTPYGFRMDNFFLPSFIWNINHLNR